MTEKHLSNDERAKQSSKERTQHYLEEIAETLPIMHKEVSKVGALAELVENNKELSETLRSGLGDILRGIHGVYTHWQENIDPVVGYAKLYTAKTQRDDGMKEVTLTINPEHYQLIEKLAGIQKTSVESLLLDAAKSALSVSLPEDGEDWESIELTEFDIHPWLKEAIPALTA